MCENFSDPSKLDLGNNNSRRGKGREELSSNRQARLLDDSCMSWRRKLETAYFTGRRIPSEKSREGTLVGAWNIGRRFTAATARKGRARKV